MSDYDVIIVGGGPAASAAALSMRRLIPHLSILMLEASDYQSDRIGETLPPGSEKLLRQLGLLHLLEQAGHTPAYGSAAAWGQARPHSNEFIFYTHGRAWHLDRKRFDRDLALTARQQGADLRMQTHFQRASRDGKSWRVEALHQGQTLHFTAKWILDASGRKAVFIRSLKLPKIRMDNLVGISQIYSGANKEGHTLIEAHPQGWFYSAKLPGQRHIMAFMTDSDLAKDLDPRQLLPQAPHTQKRLQPLQANGKTQFWPAASFRQEQFCGPGWAACGDAASTFDPLSSSGMIKALRSGMLASYLVKDSLEGKPETAAAKYQAMLSGEYDAYLNMRKDFYQQEQRWPDQAFWQRRHQTIASPILS